MINLKIDLFTTPGCEACNIMKNILHNAVELYKSATYVNIEYNVIPVDPKVHKDFSFKDFPTTFIKAEKTDKGDEMFTTLTGTYPKDYLCKVIDNFIDSSI